MVYMLKQFIRAEPKRDRDGNVIIDDDVHQQIMPIGKHRGKTFQYIFEQDPDYCDWIVELGNKAYGALKLFREYILMRRDPSAMSTVRSVEPNDSDTEVEEESEPTFTTGKKVGRTFQQVYDSNNYSDRSYTKWVANLFNPYGELKDYQVYIRERKKEQLEQRIQAQARNAERERERLERERKRQEVIKKMAEERAEKQRAEQERRHQARIAYEQKLAPLKGQVESFTSELLKLSDDPGARAVQQLMYVDGDQLAQLTTARNTSAKQWETQQKMCPGLRPLFETKKTKPLTIRTPGDSFLCCSASGRWNFAEIALHCNVNIRLWKLTMAMHVESIVLDVGAAHQIEFLVWEKTTYVLVSRANWLNSISARNIDTLLRERISAPEESRDANQSPTSRAITKIWEYFCNGIFGHSYTDDFTQATGELRAGGSSANIDKCVERTLDKYWLLYVHKHRVPRSGEDKILREMLFRKNRLEFIAFMADEAGKRGIRTEVLYVESPQSYEPCEPAQSSLAFVGLGGSEDSAAGPFKTKPIVVMQIALEIFDDGRRACGFFIRPTFEQVRIAAAANAANGGPMHFELAAAGSGPVSWANALELIQANWDGPKGFRGKLQPSRSANDPNWREDMAGCGLVFKTSQPEKKFKGSKFEKKVLDVLELIRTHPGRRDIFEHLRDTNNARTLKGMKERAEKEQRR